MRYLLLLVVSGCGGAVVDNACYDYMNAYVETAARCGHPYNDETAQYDLHSRCDTQTWDDSMATAMRTCAAKVRELTCEQWLTEAECTAPTNEGWRGNAVSK